MFLLTHAIPVGCIYAASARRAPAAKRDGIKNLTGVGRRGRASRSGEADGCGGLAGSNIPRQAPQAAPRAAISLVYAPSSGPGPDSLAMARECWGADREVGLTRTVGPDFGGFKFFDRARSRVHESPRPGYPGQARRRGAAPPVPRRLYLPRCPGRDRKGPRPPGSRPGRRREGAGP